MEHRTVAGRVFRTGITATIVAAATLIGPAVVADDIGHQAVFVQTNDPSGNAVVAYRLNPDGTLSDPDTYPTGGKGGRAASSVVDPLASQHSLVFDREHGLLFAVNAGSDTLSVFTTENGRLDLIQVVSSGGPFPVSIATHGDLLYVLDAGSAGYVSGYRIDYNGLEPIAGSTRSLGLSNANPPFFLASPAQVGFTPDGEHLIATTKSNNIVEVFAVGWNGQLSSKPVSTTVAPVPFAFTFDPSGLLVLNTAGNSALQTFSVNDNGTLIPIGAAVSDGQAAACWLIKSRGSYYVANAGSGTISQFQIGGDGTVMLVDPTEAAGIPGATDMATAARGRFLYALSGGSGTVFAYEISPNGSLIPLPSVSVPGGANVEGIAAE